MLTTILPLSPEVNAVLIGFALVVVLLALIFAAVTLTKAEKVNRLKRVETTPTAVANQSVTESKAVSVTAPVAATFEVSDLEVSPSEAKAGETVMVFARVTNTSYFSGYFCSELKINGEVVAVKRLGLAPGASRLVAFEVVKNRVGEYKVEFAGLEGYFYLNRP